MRSVLVLLLLVLPASTPWLIGLYLERLYQRGLDTLTERGYQVCAHHWQSGWLASTAVTVLAVPAAPGSVACPPEQSQAPLADGFTDGAADPPAVATAPEAGPADPPRLHIASRFDHGPRAADLRRWPPVLATGQARLRVQDAPRPLPPLRLALRLGLAGAVSGRFSLPDVTYSGAGGQLQLLGSRADLRLDADRSRLHGSGALQALQAEDEAGRRLLVAGLDWRLALHAGPVGLPVGELLLTLGEVSLREPASVDRPIAGGLPAFTAGGLRLGLTVAPLVGGRALNPEASGPAPAASGDDGGAQRLALHAAIELDRLALPASAADPDLRLAKARLVLKLAPLDAPTLAALRRGWQAIDAQGLPSSFQGLALGGLLLQHLPALLASEPRLVVEPLEMQTPAGSISASIDVGLALGGGTGPTGRPFGDPDDESVPGRGTAWWAGEGAGGRAGGMAGGMVGGTSPLAPGFWLERARGEARITLPRQSVQRWLLSEQRARAQAELQRLGEVSEPLPPALARELEAAADAALAGLIRDRWLVASGDRLSANLIIGDGLLTINGRTVPLLR